VTGTKGWRWDGERRRMESPLVQEGGQAGGREGEREREREEGERV